MPSPTFTNKLIHESSPYLLQHAHNPVDWHPWTPETLSKARLLDKMLLISIGYSACHWCHVMESESFTDRKVAEIMNNCFICIKVDREERPDVDQVYMTAVQLITGGGGWPLNCFALPDGRPFFGGTYFRKEQWKQLLENVHLLYLTRKEELNTQAEALTRGIAAQNIIRQPTDPLPVIKDDILAMKNRLKNRLDFEEGGMAGMPKFPMPVILEFLLKEVYFSEDHATEAFLVNTLQKMSFGGIFDQVGGGFARYSTDAHWKVPHFEKMLYDNAQLISVYCHAYRRWKHTNDLDVIRDTLSFIMRELGHPDGGFFSSLDADSDGGEGRYYTWSLGEFRQVLDSHADLLVRYFHVGEKGLWESGKNILLRTKTIEKFVQGTGLQPSQFRTILKTARTRLLKARNKRARPALDDKVLTSWNGLMLKGFVDAYEALGKLEYLNAAIRNANFLISEVMCDDGCLFHAWKNDRPSVNGFLEDYSYLADALLELYQVTFDRTYLDKALLLAEYCLAYFYDPEGGFFFTTSSLDAPLIARKQEIHDNVTPSPNSVMAGVLQRLGLLFDRSDLLEVSNRMVVAMKENALNHPGAFSNWASAMLDHAYPFYTVAITGPDMLGAARQIRKAGYPSMMICGSAVKSHLPILKDRFADEKTMIYLCSGNECQLPTESVEEVIEYLKSE